MSIEESSKQLTPDSEASADLPTTVSADTDQPGSEQPWWVEWIGVARAVLVWFASVMLLLFVPVIVALPYIAYKFMGSGAPSPENLQSDKTLIFLSVLGILPTHLLTLVVTWLVITQGGRRPLWSTLGFEWPRHTNRTVTTLLCVLLAFVLLGLAWLVTTLYGGSKTQLDLLIESSLPARFATALVAVATAPLVEEIVYRGVLYPAIERAARSIMAILVPGMAKTLGIVVAIVVVSLLFAGVHVFQYYNNLAVIFVITLLSITLTVVRAVTGSVVPSFIIHLVFNGIQSLVLVLAPFIEKTQ